MARSSILPTMFKFLYLEQKCSNRAEIVKVLVRERPSHTSHGHTDIPRFPCLFRRTNGSLKHTAIVYHQKSGCLKWNIIMIKSIIHEIILLSYVELIIWNNIIVGWYLIFYPVSVYWKSTENFESSFFCKVSKSFFCAGFQHSLVLNI